MMKRNIFRFLSENPIVSPAAPAPSSLSLAFFHELLSIADTRAHLSHLLLLQVAKVQYALKVSLPHLWSRWRRSKWPS